MKWGTFATYGHKKGPYNPARRFSLAAHYLGMRAPFPYGGDDDDDATTTNTTALTEDDFARMRAWSLAHYQRTSTAAGVTHSCPFGGSKTKPGRALEYFPVFKAGNNNIRFSLGVMSRDEVQSLSGGHAAVRVGTTSILNSTLTSTSRPTLTLYGHYPSSTPLAVDDEGVEVEEETARGMTSGVGCIRGDAAERRKRGEKEKVESVEDQSAPCRFTFLRDPLQRFVSAYAEFEYRQSKAFTSLVPERCATEDWATAFFRADEPAASEFVNAGAWPPAGRKDFWGRD